MKKLLSILALVGFVMSFCGCDEIPSADKVRSLSKSVGTAAALACNIGKVDQSDIDKVFVILDEVRSIVPNESQSYEEVWTPEINKIISKLVDDGKIDATKAELINKILITATKGIDLVFIRHPDWKKYPDIVSAAVNGFYDGFSILKNCDNCTVTKFEASVDKEAYELLKWR